MTMIKKTFLNLSEQPYIKYNIQITKIPANKPKKVPLTCENIRVIKLNIPAIKQNQRQKIALPLLPSTLSLRTNKKYQAKQRKTGIIK